MITTGTNAQPKRKKLGKLPPRRTEATAWTLFTNFGGGGFRVGRFNAEGRLEYKPGSFSFEEADAYAARLNGEG